MLAYYLEWNMRQALKPILFDDHDKPAADAVRASIVAKATRSETAMRKVNAKRTDDDLPVHSFQSLITDLATFTRNTMTMGDSSATFSIRSSPPFRSAPSSSSTCQPTCSQYSHRSIRGSASRINHLRFRDAATSV
jgi:hypothetical protein